MINSVVHNNIKFNNSRRRMTMRLFHIFILICIYGNYKTLGYTVNLPCTTCTGGKGQDFTGKVGGNITVSLNISFEKVAGTLNVFFNGTEIVEIKTGFSDIKVTITPTRESKRFELQPKMERVAIGTYKIVYKNLTAADNGVKFSYGYTVATKPVTVTNTIVVNAPTSIVKEAKNVYQVEEGSNTDITIKVRGNPKPNVTASIGGVNHAVQLISSSMLIHSYNLNLTNVRRTQCGKKIRFNVTSNNVIIETKPSLLIVGFTPEAPQNVKATLNLQNCLTVSWNKIESGDISVQQCSAKYTIMYNGTVTLNSTRELKFKKCRSNYTTGIVFPVQRAISIMATVNGRSSNLSEPVNITVEGKPTAIPTTSTAQPGRSKEVLFVLVFAFILVVMSKF